MTAAAVVTLVVAGLIVAAAAVGLLRVVLHLIAVRRTLEALEGGVRVIAEKTSTVPTVLPSVNASLKPVRDFCESI
ncbi:MAG TPA: hypothetical protein VLA10_05080 [Ilumatobacter sp.]|nr:hypothetical protein [Ilumatobacter sp.]